MIAKVFYGGRHCASESTVERVGAAGGDDLTGIRPTPTTAVSNHNGGAAVISQRINHKEL